MILGINLNKVNAERISRLQGNIQITNKTNITGVKSTGLTKKDAVSEICFEFRTLYLQDKKTVGKIEIDGSVLYQQDQKELLKCWKTEKKLPKDLEIPIMNAILTKCSVRAVDSAEHVNLPPPIPLLKIQHRGPDITYIG